MYKAIVHHQVTHAQRVPRQRQPTLASSPQFLFFSMTTCIMEYSIGFWGQLSWLGPLLALYTPSACLLAEQHQNPKAFGSV